MGVELLQTLSLVSYILAGLLFLAAIILFFYLKVPALWGEVTGRTARKAIRDMRWKGEYTSPKTQAGIASHDSAASKSAGIATEASSLADDPGEADSLPKERIPLVAPEHKPPLKTAPSADDAESVSAVEESCGKTSELPPAAAPHREESTPLSSSGNTVLLSKTDSGQTTALPVSKLGQTECLPHANARGTNPLPQSVIGQTSVLNATAYRESATRSTEDTPRRDETTLLGQEQRVLQNKAPDYFFVMVKELAFTDSTEIIE